MNLPLDPAMLLSVVNTNLRDRYPSLEEFAAAEDVDISYIKKQLAKIDYVYDPEKNRFVYTPAPYFILPGLWAFCGDLCPRRLAARRRFASLTDAMPSRIFQAVPAIASSILFHLLMIRYSRSVGKYHRSNPRTISLTLFIAASIRTWPAPRPADPAFPRT